MSQLGSEPLLEGGTSRLSCVPSTAAGLSETSASVVLRGDEKLVSEPSAHPYMGSWSPAFPAAAPPLSWGAVRTQGKRDHPSKSTYLHICADAVIFVQDQWF